MIGYAEQKGSLVYVYNENGSTIWTRGGILVGFTSTTVAIKQGGCTYICGERGETKYIR